MVQKAWRPPEKPPDSKRRVKKTTSQWLPPPGNGEDRTQDVLNFAECHIRWRGTVRCRTCFAQPICLAIFRDNPDAEVFDLGGCDENNY